MILKEDRDLYSGIFWIVDMEDENNNDDYCFLIPTTFDGSVDNDGSLNAKSGITYNHEKVWNDLPRTMTKGKPFDYYPRGRVQIKNSKATVYFNPNLLAVDGFERYIIDNFNLTEYNGIKDIKWKPDYSEHYKCYLD